MRWASPHRPFIIPSSSHTKITCPAVRYQGCSGQEGEAEGREGGGAGSGGGGGGAGGVP